MGILRDFFGPTKERLKNFGQIFRAFFVTNFVARTKNFRANFVLQTCHPSETIRENRAIRANLRIDSHEFQGRKNHDSHRHDRIWRDFLHWIFSLLSPDLRGLVLLNCT